MENVISHIRFFGWSKKWSGRSQLMLYVSTGKHAYFDCTVWEFWLWTIFQVVSPVSSIVMSHWVYKYCMAIYKCKWIGTCVFTYQSHHLPVLVGCAVVHFLAGWNRHCPACLVWCFWPISSLISAYLCVSLVFPVQPHLLILDMIVYLYDISFISYWYNDVHLISGICSSWGCFSYQL